MPRLVTLALLCVLLRVHAATISYHSLDLTAYLGRVTACPAHSTSNPDNTACICLAGYFRSGTACVACASGTFKDVSGDQACSNCIDHRPSSTAVAAATSIDDCLCDPGHYLLAQTCTVCLVNTYKPYFGAQTCTDCPVNSIALEGSNALTACQCNSGFTGPDGGPCTACLEGSYKDSPGSQGCTPCSNHMTSSLASSTVAQCQCLPGYTGTNGGSCSPCSAGSFKASQGETSCSACLANTQSAEGASACVANPGFTFRNRVRFTMRINKTLQQFDSAAQELYKQDIATRAGVLLSQVTIVSITETPTNTIRRLLSTSLDVETEISTSPDETDSVTTSISNGTNSNADTTLIGDTTVESTVSACPVNTYKADPGDQSCTPCPANSHSTEGSTECTCNPGYRGDFLNCQKCAYDHFCVGDGTMLECPGNSTAPEYSVSENNCTCLGGFQKEEL